MIRKTVKGIYLIERLTEETTALQEILKSLIRKLLMRIKIILMKNTSLQMNY